MEERVTSIYTKAEFEDQLGKVRHGGEGGVLADWPCFTSVCPSGQD